MSSPIHTYLFSPPSSPGLTPRASPSVRSFNSPVLASVAQLLPDTLLPHPHRGSVEGLGFGNELKPRSPRTPQARFTFGAPDAVPAYPAPAAVHVASAYPVVPKLTVEDVERSPRVTKTPVMDSVPATPRWRADKKARLDPEYQAANVPSAPLALPSGLPRPVLRLLIFGVLVLTSLMLLVLSPGARLPSLREASTTRRLKLDVNGKAAWDLSHAATSFQAALDRDYVPPKVRAPHMMRRAFADPASPGLSIEAPSAAAHPRTSIPAYHHPVPAAHEMLALQSYVLQSSYNVLPPATDAAQPLDATVVSGLGRGRLGPIGGAGEQEWLAELEVEIEKEVTVWFGLDGTKMHPHRVLTALEEIHGNDRHPSLVPCHSRQDRETLQALLSRLQGVERVSAPILTVGHTAIVATDETLDRMVQTGELKALMGKVGWVKREGKAWKPKLAKVKKREVSEVEAALKKA